ncbi:MAG: periplasmic heavy metal sensor [Rickettsiales bacterium]|nr:periplasmic heavy metal sensor [Rickettsiales bacterium]
MRTTKHLLLLVMTSLLTLGAFSASANHWKHREAQIDAAVAQLPADKAATTKESIAKMRAEEKAGWQKAKALHEKMRSILEAETFDSAAYLANSKAIREQMNLIAEARDKTVIDVASKLTAKERQSLVAAMYQKHAKDSTVTKH